MPLVIGHQYYTELSPMNLQHIPELLHLAIPKLHCKQSVDSAQNNIYKLCIFGLNKGCTINQPLGGFCASRCEKISSLV